ncbi:hypothetical protein Pmani_031295 [Petrolisthes manimaculis]|uniref:Kazal-like domain-containing protein n=1 Tax=Petrolisthes manimaculis TaxID=1843537 RepID=A0AAE1NW04_9EUCA|nr:hypothetical protein Pmani_031295 [Petrolisthes manimaculis]
MTLTAKVVSLFSLAFTARCQSDCDFGCSGVWDPVCGTDGITYSNLCSLQHADCKSDDDIILTQQEGECQPPIQEALPWCLPEVMMKECSLATYSPVCELTTSTTYTSTCHLCQAQYQAQAAGENIVYIIDHLEGLEQICHCTPATCYPNSATNIHSNTNTRED